MNKRASIKHELLLGRNTQRAKLVARYFKTGKGEYGEGDVFIGLTVPQIRSVARRYNYLPLRNIETLLQSKIHEYRLTALVILSAQFKKADAVTQKTYFDFYLSHTKWINNWDLIDLSSRDIVGGYLLDKKGERKILYRLVRSKSIWEKRTAVLATFQFIAHDEFRDSLRIAELLLGDTHDLIHKAVGWMLREIGKRDEKSLIDFLAKHYKTMPRTMLRYAIEKFDLSTRVRYLRGEV